MVRIVIKFGGSVLRNGDDYRKAAEEVIKLLEKGNDVVVIVSAMKGVTDKLLKLTQLESNWENTLNELYEQHVNVIKELNFSGSLMRRVYDNFVNLFNELYKIVYSVHQIGEVTPRIRDYILSFGERWSALLMWSTLIDYGVESVYLTGREAGIVTDDNFGNAKPIPEITNRLVVETIEQYLKHGVVPVITGFIAGTIDGKITTLGRGGSDYTATLIGSIIKANEIRLYTDVPGVLTGNPSLMPNTKIVPEMSYEEAIICAQLGAKKFHPKTFEPVKDTEIRTIITCIEGFEKGLGTVISSRKVDPPVKVVSLVPDLALIYMDYQGFDIDDITTTLSLLSRIVKESINLYAFIHQVTRTDLTILIKRQDVQTLIKILNELKNRGLVRKFNVVDNVSLVSIIGHGVNDSSVLGYLLADIPNAWIYDMFIGDVSFSIIIDNEHAIKLAVSIHDRMVMKWWS